MIRTQSYDFYVPNFTEIFLSQIKHLAIGGYNKIPYKDTFEFQALIIAIIFITIGFSITWLYVRFIR